MAQRVECIFCKIICGSAPAKIQYRDEMVTAFDTIHPLSPIHILIVPNKHIPSVNEIENDDERLLGHMFMVARTLAIQFHIDSDGYRLMINTGKMGGQSVFHLHMHLLAGRRK